ncbi:MAG: hypothetical protein WCA49_09390 [Candidatus Sulfotelmatobacter sp.]
MRRRAAVLALVVLSAETALLAQNAVSQQAVSQQAAAQGAEQQSSPSYLPHPFVYAGTELMGAGYAPLAGDVGGGLRIDSRHFLASAEGSYDNGHKTNDNDQPNPSGHDRGLVGTSYFRFSSGWFLGAGARWSQLSTTNYAKSAWRPTFGGGKDYFHRECSVENCAADFSFRLGVDYVLPGADHSNAVQGPLISFYMPSPSAKGHFFFRLSQGIYEFHETVTEPSNLTLTRQQIGDRSVTSFCELTLMYRF